MAIIFNHVYHTYAQKTPFQAEALQDVNVTLVANSFTAIIGHTGSGKSTLIQHINALLLPTQGMVSVNGIVMQPKHMPKQVKALRQYAGVVFQFPEYQLFEETVEQDIMFGPLNIGLSKKDALVAAKDALNQVGLDAKFLSRSPFELSGGERRRVAIAGILAMNPKVLILDEPTAGLDPEGAQAMMALFTQLHQQGMTIIFVTHDMDLVWKHATHVMVMDQGRVSQYATPIELFLNSKQTLTVENPKMVDFLLACQQAGMPGELASVKDLDTLMQRWQASHKENR
jgi:energy-coupling factor transport system ATP-binding protein